MGADPTQREISEIYANISQVSVSPSDISITLGVSAALPLGEAEFPRPTTVAILRMSPSAAKMLQLGLAQMLDVYEERFGKIYVPKEFIAALNEGGIQLGLGLKTGASS